MEEVVAVIESRQVRGKLESTGGGPPSLKWPAGAVHMYGPRRLSARLRHPVRWRKR